MTPATVPDNSRIVEELLTLPAMYGSHRGKPGGTILALNPKGYGSPVLAPCPCRACKSKEESK